MSSLAIFTPPNQQKAIDDLARALRAADERGDRLEDELRTERRKNAAVEQGATALREILAPLYQGIGMILGHIEAMGVSPAGEPAQANSRTSAVWNSWKSKVSGSAAKAIDALLLHGEMTAEQLRIHLGCATRTCYNIIGELNKAKLINKNGGRISLKEL
jgi:hypothetical protein